MSENSLYPTKREKAMYESTHAKVEKYHQVTSSAIVLFRKTYSLLIFIYMLLLVVSGFELLANLMADGPLIRARTVPLGLVFLMATLIAISMLMHNQVLLILGHGYKEKSAQLYVDHLTSLADCYVSLKLIRTMYVLAIFMPLIMLLPLWWFAGAESISEQINLQIAGFHSLVEAMSVNGEGVAAADNAYKHIKWYLWGVTIALVIAVALSVLGWLQATVARSRI